MILSPDRLHHAYVIEGDVVLGKGEVVSFCEKELVGKMFGNPDVLFFEEELFGIDEVRRLKEFQIQKPLIGDRKVVLVSFSSTTTEAQNAFLKVLEEPSGGTIIFILVPSVHILLPTVLSRSEVVRVGGVGKESFGKEFLLSKSSKRIELISEIVKEKNTDEAQRLLDDIEGILAEKLAKEKSPEIAEAIKEVFNARNFLWSRSPSIKMILEHLSLVLPVVNG